MAWKREKDGARHHTTALHALLRDCVATLQNWCSPDYRAARRRVRQWRAQPASVRQQEVDQVAAVLRAAATASDG